MNNNSIDPDDDSIDQLVRAQHDAQIAADSGGPARLKRFRDAVAQDRELQEVPVVKAPMAVWRTPIFKWIATGIAASIMLAVFFIAGGRHGDFNALAAITEAQNTVQLPKQRQYAISISRVPSTDGKSDMPLMFDHATLRTKGSERYVFQTTRQGLMGATMPAEAGRDEQGCWAYIAPIPSVFRTQQWAKFDEAMPDFHLRYMELKPILSALLTDFDVVDLGEESAALEGHPGLHHVQAKLKAQHGGRLQSADLWIDSDSEIWKLDVSALGFFGGKVRMVFTREKADFENDSVFQPEHYCPEGTRHVNLEGAHLKNLLAKLRR